MKVGLNLFSIRNLIKTEEDFLDTAKKLSEMGYAYLQYSGAPFEPERIARVSKATGLPVYLTHVPMDRIISDTEKLMDEHELFGCKNIGLGMMPLEITVNDDGVRVVRSGAIVSDILFKENFLHKSLYTLPPYSFDMEVTTSRIRRGEGRLDIFYKMTLGGQDKRVKMTLDWK